MPRSTDGARPNVAWWSALLLLLLGSVFVGLFIAGRLLLSLEREAVPDAPAPPRPGHFDATPPAQLD
jgi:hypothetical protein